MDLESERRRIQKIVDNNAQRLKDMPVEQREHFKETPKSPELNIPKEEEESPGDKDENSQKKKRRPRIKKH